MYKNIELSASLMCANWLSLKDQILSLEENGIDYMHYDIADGIYAPDFTMGSSIINTVKENTKLPGHYHLMVEEPMRLFENFDLNKNEIFTIHQETSKNLHRDLINIKNKAKVACAISPATPLEYLEYIIEELDNVLVLSVNPGFKSQKLIPQTIRKIEKLKNLIEKMGLDITITADGNINKSNVPDFIKAGASILVLGSSGLFRKDATIKESVEEIKESIDKVL
jgi:ribulose-phosphate 3-epimerase|tara:strand:+ start:539 stop:1213 length:675 start_codon:yes stop_codon:yes gene_type:complete